MNECFVKEKKDKGLEKCVCFLLLIGCTTVSNGPLEAQSIELHFKGDYGGDKSVFLIFNRILELKDLNIFLLAICFSTCEKIRGKYYKGAIMELLIARHFEE